MNDEEIVITEVTEVTQVEEPAEPQKKEKRKKHGKIGKIIAYAAVFLVVGCAVTALSAVLPKLPYTFTQTEQIKTVDFGFPLGFASQTRTDDEVSALVDGDFNKNVNKGFLLPRYDLYETGWSVGALLGDIAINTALVAAVCLFFVFFPRVAKKSLKFAVFGLLVCLLFCLLPALPGTFTADELEPMHFGFPLKYLEQTPDVGTIKTNENLDLILKQNFLSPNLLNSDSSRTTTHFVAYKLLLSIALNAILLAAVANLITVLKILINGGGKEKVAKHYSERFDSLVLRPLEKKNMLPEKTALRLAERTEALKLAEKKGKKALSDGKKGKKKQK